jgi:hypothetical protein
LSANLSEAGDSIREESNPVSPNASPHRVSSPSPEPENDLDFLSNHSSPLVPYTLQSLTSRDQQEAAPVRVAEITLKMVDISILGRDIERKQATALVVGMMNLKM